jgi:hypothetical protein
MSQEAITEIDMDVFSRRIGPYFSWLESRIESGWQQSDSVQKDVLKEVKYLATTMRARFILGVSKDDFAKEVKRTLELFELASDAFPSESDEVESKTKHFCKGVSEELGSQFIPQEHREPLGPGPMPMPEPLVPDPEPDPLEPDEEKAIKITPEIKTAPRIEKVKTEKPKIVKVKVEKLTKIEKPAEVTIAKLKVQKAKPVKEPAPKAQEKPAKKTKKKSFFLVRWVKSFIYGED